MNHAQENPTRHRAAKERVPAASAPVVAAARTPDRARRNQVGWQLLGAGLLVVATGLATIASRGWWLPAVTSRFGGADAHDAAATAGASDADHAEDDHDHAADAEDDHPGHDAENSFTLSTAARQSIGLELVRLAHRDFVRTISVPATIVARAGRSNITVSAPMTGIITRIYRLQGEAVVPGQPLFDLRLTHEDLVEKQSELLRDLQQLDVVDLEAARLEEAARAGTVAGKRLLEQVYEQRKLKAAIAIERQALQLHGLSADQVAALVDRRQFLEQVQIVAPAVAAGHEPDHHEELLQLHEIAVSQGDHVTTGTRLAMLSDHCQLYIEGLTFEQDAAALNRVVSEGLPVSAVIGNDNGEGQLVSDLKMLYVENQVDRNSRALRCYVMLPNTLVRNEVTAEQRRFISWRFRPGQRVELRLPAETWSDCIVLPAVAVVQDGAESFVYGQTGDHFDRVEVHVRYRDRQWAVLADAPALEPGTEVAGKGAYQIHLALKNQSGAGVDPHAGHNH